MRWILCMSMLFATGCTRYGACHGWSDTFNTAYCHDDWSEDSCDEWDQQDVNGADWYWHPGQTCADRGVAGS